MKKHVKKIHEQKHNVLVNVIIPPAGVGRRMKSYGCKSLLTINNEKLIDIQLKHITNVFEKHEVILITGFDSDRLINHSPSNLIKIENEKYYENNVVINITS